MSIALGDRIGKFRLDRQIGRGGMGVIYEGVHGDTGQRVAIKVLVQDLADEPRAAERFLNEARALSAVRHPGLVQIFDTNRMADGTLYLIMELLHGETLAQRLKGGRLPAPQALRFTRQIAAALAAVHDRGIIHRDLKPENVFVVPDEEAPGGERIKLLDFGIARFTDEERRTSSGVVVGTPRYMSPEQIGEHLPVDTRTDVYSLGVVFYEMLTGAPPFLAQGIVGLMFKHVQEEPRPPREIVPETPPEVEELVRWMMAKAPPDRPTMAKVVERIRAMEGMGMSSEVPAVVPVKQATERAETRAVVSAENNSLARGEVGSRRRRRQWAVVLAAAGAGVLGVVGVRLMWMDDGGKEKPAATVVEMGGGVEVGGVDQKVEAADMGGGGADMDVKESLDMRPKRRKGMKKADDSIERSVQGAFKILGSKPQ